MTDETSAQEAAVDAMARAVFESEIVGPRSSLVDEQPVRDIITVALDALLSPTKKPCAKCDELGFIRADDADKDCPDCIDGFVSSPAPIEGLLERPSHVNVFEAGKTLVRLMPVAEPVFRLPSKVREG